MSRVFVAPIIGQSAASGAQVIDGSLKFNNDLKTHLSRTPSTPGDRRVWTWSGWVKKSNATEQFAMFTSGEGSGNDNYGMLWFQNNGVLYFHNWDGQNNSAQTNATFRDTGWYHVVARHDEGASTKMRFYVNGVEKSLAYNLSTSTGINRNVEHRIGQEVYNARKSYDGRMSQIYFIDGQSIGPEYFGFTDPLTNTWKPKKYTNTTTTAHSITGSPSLSNGALIIKAEGSTIAGRITSGGGNLNYYYSSNGIDWTRQGAGTNAYFTGYKYLAAGGAGTSGRTFVPSPNGNYSYHVWNDNTNFDQGSDHTTDVTSKTFTDQTEKSNFGSNGFYLPLDGNSPIGQDKSGRGNDWTPVNFGGSVALDNPQVTGARPILNTTQGGAQAGVGVFGSKENQNVTVTVASKTGGGNAYFFDGVERDSLATIRGSTITFDTTDSTNNTHPFKLSSTNADSSGGTEYTDGVAYYINGSTVSGSDYVSNYSTGAASGFRGIKWTVPHNVSTTYYYCTVHNGMGEGGRLTSTTDETKADPYAWKVVYSTPLVGSNTDFTGDISSVKTSRVNTSNGNAKATDATSNFYNGSFTFDGTGDYVSSPYNSDYDFSNGEFTVEAWFNTTQTGGYPGGVNRWQNANTQCWDLRASTTDKSDKAVFVYNDGSVKFLESGRSVNDGNWHHLAVTRSGNTLNFFVDGVKTASDSYSGTINQGSDTELRIGYNDTTYYNGKIQDVRIYKGVARYTSDFVVPSRSPDILPDTPSGVSNSSKLAKITDGAVAFEGNATTKLTLADSTDFTFGTNDFCIEFFYYNKALPDNGTYDIIFDCMGSNRSGIQLAIETDNDYRIEVGDGSNNWIWQSTGFDSKSRKWTHFALTREGSTFRAFEDGVLLGTQTSSTAVGDPRSPAIGGYASDDSTNYGFNGYISNFRIVNGSAVYTAAFTPPTAPLTNITNTKLLTCQTATTYQIAAVAPLVSGVNSGTVWSSSLTADSLFRSSSYPAKDAFNGVTKTSTEDCAATPQVAGQGFTFTFGEGVSFTTLQMQCDHNNGATVRANGVDITSQLSSGSLTNTTITGVTSPLTSLSVVSHNGDAGYLGSVTIDGTMLVDPLVPNGDAKATTFNPFNTDINTVRGQETGYPTWNPLDQGSGVTLSEGNSKASVNGTTNSGVRGTVILPKSGKYFFAIEMNVIDNAADAFAGLMYMQQADTVRDVSAGGARLIVRGSGSILNDSTGITGLSFVGDGYDELGVAVDCDANTVQFYVNGAPSASAQTPSVSITEGWAPHCACSSGTSVFTLNAGQKPFKFPPPDGFQPLNTANARPTKVISRPDKFVGVTTYTGNSTGQAINMGFKPDLLWIKSRTNSGAPAWMDSVRGSDKQLNTNNQNAQSTNSATAGVLSLNSKGFILGTESSATGSTNGSQNYVAWGWKAGGGKSGGGGFFKDDVEYASAAAAGLTGGDRSLSAASVNTKTGFSILKWTNGNTTSPSSARVPHGLTQSPDFVIYKDTDSTSANWAVKSEAFSNPVRTEFYLDSTDQAPTAGVDLWFRDSDYIGHRETSIGGNGNPMMAYCWHDVPGLQKFGKYFGNSDADGPYIELGFRPALLIVRRIEDNGNEMVIFDSERTKINQTSNNSAYLRSPDAGSEGTANNVDFLSNGFKWRKSDSYTNDSGSSTGFIYAAWAEAPSIDLYGGGANAR